MPAQIYIGAMNGRIWAAKRCEILTGERSEGAMTGSVAMIVERIGHWLRRFLSEVIASVATTACVAGATTLYLNYGATPPSPPPAAPVANLAPLLSPVADPGAVGLVASLATEAAK